MSAGVAASDPSAPASAFGVGWRQPHYREVLERRPPLDFLEVHSENFFGDGGAALAVLEAGRACYDVSLHGVGLGLASAAGLDPWHLERLAALTARIQPRFVSDHACFARAPRGPGQAPVHAGDLLPMAFTDASLDLLARHVQQVQDRLKRPLLVENISAYLSWDDDHWSEPEFFNALCRRTGCLLLLDVNNLVVNALNRGDPDAVSSACAWVDALAPGVVGEIHLAGYDDRSALVIDDHGSVVREPVWQVYRRAVARFGAVPTLVEWDTELPALDMLLRQAGRAAEEMRTAREEANVL